MYTLRGVVGIMSGRTARRLLWGWGTCWWRSLASGSLPQPYIR